MRAFIAIELSDAVRAAVEDALRGLAAAAAHADVRWVEAARSHLTVKFLGEIAPERTDAVVAALRQVATSRAAIAIATGPLGAFPAGGRPRVVWLGVTGGIEPLRQLAGAIDAALAPLGVPAEPRPFAPHLTLGRMRSPRGAGELAHALASVTPPSPTPWTVETLTLFRSHLERTGARHEALARVPLGGGANA